jgi:hypothetical protein
MPLTTRFRSLFPNKFFHSLNILFWFSRWLLGIIFDCDRSVLPTPSRYFSFKHGLLVLFCVLAFAFETNAQSPVFAYNFAVGGTSKRSENGVMVIAPGTKVYLTTKFSLVRPYVGTLLMHSGTTILTADANGKWQTELPCYYDLNGQYTGSFEVKAYVVGVSGWQSALSGGHPCSNSSRRRLLPEWVLAPAILWDITLASGPRIILRTHS